MSPAVKRASIALGVVAGVVGIFVFDHLMRAGSFSRLKTASIVRCSPLELSEPAQDIRVDLLRGIAYLSVRNGRGTVLLMDLNVEEPRPRAALASQPQAFRPRGLSLYAPADGPRRLFVVNEPAPGDYSVEIFEETETGAFAPVESLRDPLLVQPDSIAAVGPRQFYVANESGASPGIGQLFERLFRRGLSTIVFFDGEQMRVVADGLKGVTGLAISNHGLSVFVSEGLGKQLLVYDRDSATNELAPRNVIPLEGAPDNVSIDADGTLWFAAHPKLLALRAHLRDASARSPTLIYRLRRSVIEKEDRLSIPYLNLGEELSAGSTAAAHGDRMLIGAATSRKLLVCRLPANL
jgi:arylesterase / paraoxonase